jgi:riboflavin biosynthesis pyrimidine reductase
VLLSGGASVIQQALRVGLVDEFQLHVAPVLLGGGTPLFAGLGPDDLQVEPVRVVESPSVTHLKYHVVR